MIDKLKPCPFCGSTGAVRHRKGNNDFVPECSNSLCMASYMIGNSFDTKEGAIAAWNQRKEGGENNVG